MTRRASEYQGIWRHALRAVVKGQGSATPSDLNSALLLCLPLQAWALLPARLAVKRNSWSKRLTVKRNSWSKGWGARRAQPGGTGAQ